VLLFAMPRDESSHEFDRLPESLFPPIIRAIRLNDQISADSAYRELSQWNNYPSIPIEGHQYLFGFYDSLFGEIPFRVYVPETYRNTQKTPLLLLLHGAVGGSSFNDARDYLNPSSAVSKDASEDPFFNFFSKKDYIIVMPIGDPRKKFDWSINKFAGFAGIDPPTNNGVNATYKTLTKMISAMKASFNIDDNRVYCMGHSDGADGTFCLGLTQPSQFGAFVIYNSMLANLGSNNTFLNNLKNIRVYAVHSDKDDLRPIEQTREIINQANKFLSKKIIYKEYYGFQHFDKHLTLDAPYAGAFLEDIRRDPHPADIYWESNNATDNGFAWLFVDKYDMTMPRATWQTAFYARSFEKRYGTWESKNYYGDNLSYAIRGHYANNSFDITTSRVTSFEIYLDPSQVDMDRPVTVSVNGKRLFNGIVPRSKAFLLKKFEESPDRRSIWIAAIKIKVA
ncbi:MAG TPA: alpha/beta hydrolase-fold protein, partial [Puia sp.]|nr:alpha/beta hydrolase-fold protein [Puia sp.]